MNEQQMPEQVMERPAQVKVLEKTLTSPVPQEDQPIVSVINELGLLADAHPDIDLHHELAEMDRLHNQLVTTSGETHLPRQTTQNNAKAYTVNKVSQKMDQRDQARQQRDRHPLSKLYIPPKEALPDWLPEVQHITQEDDSVRDIKGDTVSSKIDGGNEFFEEFPHLLSDDASLHITAMHEVEEESKNYLQEEEKDPELVRLEQEREELFAKLSMGFFPNKNLVTAQDILDLHLASATLADMNTVTGGAKEDTENTKRNLEFEIRDIVNKIVRNIASAAANEMRKFPSEEILSNSEIQKKLQPLFEKDPTLKEFLSRDQYSLPLYLQELSLNLQEETESDLHEEIEFALKYCELGAQYKTWKDVGKNAYALYTKNSYSFSDIESLINSFHQGGSNDEPEMLWRPFFEHISDQPWEVANVLTAVNAGVPLATPVRPSSNIRQLAMPYRATRGVEPYIYKGDLTQEQINSLRRSTEDIIKPNPNKPDETITISRQYYRDSLIFDPSIPMEKVREINPDFNMSESFLRIIYKKVARYG